MASIFSILLSVIVTTIAAHKSRYSNTCMDRNGNPITTTLEANEANLCDPTATSFSGYFSVGGDKQYFYWFFESRNSPKNDPIMMWLSGGPGCSSILALLNENGPCYVNEHGTDTIFSETSWNERSNMVYIDQPPGTGFSTGPLNTNQDQIAEDMYAFLQNFMAAFPQYFKNGLVITGESYAGHYVPNIAYYIYEQNNCNNLLNKNPNIPLQAFVIGNGLTNTYVQFSYNPIMAFNSGTARSVITRQTYIEMESNVSECQALIKQCNDNYPDGEGDQVCVDAINFCQQHLENPVIDTGVNPFNLNEDCVYSLYDYCYNLSHIEKWLNTPQIQKKLGVDSFVHWVHYTPKVTDALLTDVVINYDTKLPDMLENGIRGLIYNGDLDFLANWLGNEAWALQLEWNGKDAFNDVKAVSEWKPDGKNGETRGILRSAKGFELLQFHGAGHFVGVDQPEFAQKMINQFLDGGLASNCNHKKKKKRKKKRKHRYSSSIGNNEFVDENEYKNNVENETVYSDKYASIHLFVMIIGLAFIGIGASICTWYIKRNK